MLQYQLCWFRLLGAAVPTISREQPTPLFCKRPCLVPQWVAVFLSRGPELGSALGSGLGLYKVCYYLYLFLGKDDSAAFTTLLKLRQETSHCLILKTIQNMPFAKGVLAKQMTDTWQMTYNTPVETFAMAHKKLPGIIQIIVFQLMSLTNHSHVTEYHMFEVLKDSSWWNLAEVCSVEPSCHLGLFSGCNFYYIIFPSRG